MSKSYKKECGTIVAGKSSKSGKASYNSQNRTKTKQVLKEIKNANGKDVESADSLVDKGIDYSLSKADNWNWDSDGKAYISDTTLHQRFMRELNDENLMTYYNFYWDTKDKSIIQHNLDKCMFDYVGSGIETEEELKSILSYNEKDILQKYRKIINKK